MVRGARAAEGRVDGAGAVNVTKIASIDELYRFVATKPSDAVAVFAHDVVYHLTFQLVIQGLRNVRFVGPVTLAKQRVLIRDCSGVHMQNVRFRLGNEGGAEDCCTIYESDHCSLVSCSGAWSVDEVFSLTKSRYCAIKSCILAYPLNNSVHPKGEHGLISSLDGDQLLFDRNYCAHALFRPEIVGSAAVTNCTFYDYRQFPVLIRPHSRVDLLDNLIAAGPTNAANRRFAWCGSGDVASVVHGSGNVWSDRRVTLIAGGHEVSQWPSLASAGTAWQIDAGAQPRDRLDALVIQNWKHNRGGLIDKPEDLAGGWQLLELA